jgi:hypothetical protein
MVAQYPSLANHRRDADRTMIAQASIARKPAPAASPTLPDLLRRRRARNASHMLPCVQSVGTGEHPTPGAVPLPCHAGLGAPRDVVVEATIFGRMQGNVFEFGQSFSDTKHRIADINKYTPDTSVWSAVAGQILENN